MFVTADYIEFFVSSVIPLSKPIQKRRDDVGVDVPDEEVIDMPTNRQLFAIDGFVGNTGVVSVP